MVMESFATPTDMADRSNQAITATSHPFLEREIAAATRAIRNECGWHIAKTEALTYKRRGPFAADVWLPAREIKSVELALVDGVQVDDVEFDPDTGWTSLCGRVIEVNYTAGFADVPADLVTLTLELAAGGVGSPLGITREQAGGVSVTLGRASSKLQPADLDALSAYRIGWQA